MTGWRRAAVALHRAACASVCAAAGGLLASGAAHAAWTPVDATETSYDYLDPSTVRVEGGLRRVWTLHDLAQVDADGDRSYRNLLEFHCPESRYRSLQTLFYAGAMGTGRMTGRTAQPGAWRPVQSASVAATVMLRVCAVR
jgi:hypothetical protein